MMCKADFDGCYLVRNLHALLVSEESWQVRLAALSMVRLPISPPRFLVGCEMLEHKAHRLFLCQMLCARVQGTVPRRWFTELVDPAELLFMRYANLDHKQLAKCNTRPTRPIYSCAVPTLAI
eukprot:scaffold79902_cov22-Tisochrysis_lutea.AAC.2